MAEQVNVGSGLINKRKNCFLNSAIQALFHVPALRICLNERLGDTEKCTIHECVTCTFIDLFKNTQCHKEPCSPYVLYKGLQKMKSFTALLNGKHQDSHEFLMLLTEALFEQPHSVPWLRNNFIANIVTHVNCSSCGEVHKSASEVADFALDVHGNQSIQLAMHSYFEYDDIEFMCESCRTYDIVKKKHFLLSAPDCLLIQLKRFSEGGEKTTDKIEISSELNLGKYFLRSQSISWKYKLVAVINHFGQNRNIGHYSTIVLKPNNVCYEFDDLNVREVSSNLVTGKNEYLLFYELMVPAATDVNVENATQYNEENSNERNEETNDLLCEDENFMERNSDRTQNSFNDSIQDYTNLLECISAVEDGNIASPLSNTAGLEPNNEIDDREEREIRNITESGEVSLGRVVLDRPQTFLQPPKQHVRIVIGRRIVDIDYFYNQMTQLTDFSCTECADGRIIFKKEIARGLHSSFIFGCNTCKKTMRFNSCPINDDSENINLSSVLGITAVGLGYYHLQEFLGHLNVPVMSYVTYHKLEEEIQAQYFKLSKGLEAEALAEEIRLAKENNEVDSAGNALIAAEFDGSWDKRAYSNNFTSLGGCAAIIGLRTKKILYSGVKTKYCHVCKIAESKKVQPRIHKCNRNWDGPSSGMETQIIIEGFKFCAEKGARINRYVGDGDSSTYKALRDLQLYKEPHIPIEKFECVNHLFRNFFKQFKALLNSSKVNLKGRKLLSLEFGRKLCKGIRLAAKHWRNSAVDMAEKYSNLEHDVMNAFSHYLDIHDNCAKYFCTNETNPEAVNKLKILKETGVYYKVLDLCQSYFGNNARSLIAGLCTNKTEGFNSLIAKTIGAKRVCNSMDGSYELRTKIADVQYNSEGHSGSKIQEFIFGESLPICKKMENARKRKCEKNATEKMNKPKTYHSDEPATKKKKKNRKTHYGDGHESDDMAEPNFNVAKKRHLDRLRENQEDRDAIELETRAQYNCFKWGEIRRIMLTSSYFGRILSVRSRSSYTNIVEEICYNNIQGANTAALRHQRVYEKEALPIFSSLYPFEAITKCGIFIDEKIPFLGASPYRLYGENGIVMIKCPKKEFGKSMKDAIKTISFWTGNVSDRRVNCKSHWYLEAQGQLHIAKKETAYLMIYLGNEVYEVVEIEKNDGFWKEHMEKVLVYFYNEALLKELVNPRYERGMELRKYNPKKEIFE